MHCTKPVCGIWGDSERESPDVRCRSSAKHDGDGQKVAADRQLSRKKRRARKLPLKSSAPFPNSKKYCTAAGTISLTWIRTIMWSPTRRSDTVPKSGTREKSFRYFSRSYQRSYFRPLYAAGKNVSFSGTGRIRSDAAHQIRTSQYGIDIEKEKKYRYVNSHDSVYKESY